MLGREESVCGDLKDDAREFHFNIVVTLRGHYDVAKLARGEREVGCVLRRHLSSQFLLGIGMIVAASLAIVIRSGGKGNVVKLSILEAEGRGQGEGPAGVSRAKQ